MNHDTCRSILRTALLGGALDSTNAVRSALAEMGGMPIALNALATAMGAQIKVNYGTSKLGATDGKSIQLMNLPIPSNKDDIDTLVLMTSLAYGLGYHELGHVSESDFSALERLNTMLKKGETIPLVESFFRIIEDVRMESAFLLKWPNTRKYLDSLTQSLYLTGFYTHVPADAAPMSALTGYLLYRLYHDYRGDVGTLDLAKEAREVCLKLFSEGFMTRLDALLPQLDHLADSNDALTMAQNLARFIEKEKEDLEQPADSQQDSGQSQDGQGDEAGTSSDGDATAQGDAAGSQGDQGTQQGASDSSGGSGTDQSSQSDTAAQGGNDTTDDGSTSASSKGGSGAGGAAANHLAALQSLLDPSNDDARVGERADAIRQALEDVVQQVGADTSGTLRLDNAAIAVDIARTEPASNDGPNQDCILSDALAVTGQLRRSFKRHMEALTQAEVSVHRRGRRISASHLHRVAGNDNRVFKSVSPEIDVDTAVAIGMDRSSSMAGSAMALTCEAVFASAVALEGIDGVTCGAFTFPYNQLILPFGRKAKHIPDSFRINAIGGTPMDEGVYLGTRMLLARRTARRVMILVTDGEPNNPAATVLATEYAISQGIEVYVMGIGDAHNVCNFPNWMDLNSIQQLPEVVTQLFSRKVNHAA